jgi:hypothetical protein
VISARCEKDELRVGASDDIGSSDQPFAIEGSCESEGTRLREDGLVKVKESRLRHLATVSVVGSFAGPLLRFSIHRRKQASCASDA